MVWGRGGENWKKVHKWGEMKKAAAERRPRGERQEGAKEEQATEGLGTS